MDIKLWYFCFVFKILFDNECKFCRNYLDNFSQMYLHLLHVRVHSWNEQRPEALGNQFIFLCLRDGVFQILFRELLFQVLFQNRKFISQIHTHSHIHTETRNSGLYTQLVTSLIINPDNLFNTILQLISFKKKKVKY